MAPESVLRPFSRHSGRRRAYSALRQDNSLTFAPKWPQLDAQFVPPLRAAHREHVGRVVPIPSERVPMPAEKVVTPCSVLGNDDRTVCGLESFCRLVAHTNPVPRNKDIEVARFVR